MKLYNAIYIEILNNVLKRRKQNNAAYSLRAFAKSLNISATSLSRILNGKRPLTLDRAMGWCEILALESDERTRFLEAVKQDQYERLNETEKKHRELEADLDYHLLRLDQFEVISKWYYLTILNLIEIDRFNLNVNSIVSSLGIEKDDAIEAISRLERLGLIGIKNGKYHRLEKCIVTPSDIPSQSIRNYQAQNIQRALHSLENDSIELRDITSITMPMNLCKIAEAKKKIKNFRREMSILAQSGKNEEVYNLNIQLFPQSRISK